MFRGSCTVTYDVSLLADHPGIILPLSHKFCYGCKGGPSTSKGYRPRLRDLPVALASVELSSVRSTPALRRALLILCIGPDNTQVTDTPRHAMCPSSGCGLQMQPWPQHHAGAHTPPLPASGSDLASHRTPDSPASRTCLEMARTRADVLP